jgi:hypothetical protein
MKLKREQRRFRWTDGHKSGFVKAYSRSEARALVKLELGISRKKRVPIGIAITEASHATS